MPNISILRFRYILLMALAINLYLPNKLKGLTQQGLFSAGVSTKKTDYPHINRKQTRLIILLLPNLIQKKASKSHSSM